MNNNYEGLWDRSDIGRAALTEAHSYRVGDNAPPPTFARVEKFDRAEPLRDLTFEGPLPRFIGYDEEGGVLAENPMPELTRIPAPGYDTRGNPRAFSGASLSPRRPASDPWKDWNRARARKLLGGERVTRTGRGYTAFPADPDVNRAILGCANKYIPAHFDHATGIPCEEFRDLCSVLAMKVEITAEGGYNTHYLAQHAAVYIRTLTTPQSVNQNQLRNKRNTP